MLTTLRKHPYRFSNLLQATVAVLALFCAVCDTVSMAIEGPYLYVGRVPCELLILFLYSASLFQNAWRHYHCLDQQQQQHYHKRRRRQRGLRLQWSLPVLLALIFVWVGELLGTMMVVSRWNQDRNEREATSLKYSADYHATVWRCLPGDYHCTPRNMAWVGIILLIVAMTFDAIFTWKVMRPRDRQGSMMEEGGGGTTIASSNNNNNSISNNNNNNALPPMGMGLPADRQASGSGKNGQYYQLDNVQSVQR